MQVVSFMNMKGGVGKTTLAVNVAYTLVALFQKKVLFVDCDPQFNASQYFVTPKAYLAHIGDKAKYTIKDIFIPRTTEPLNTVEGTAKQVDKTHIGLRDCAISIVNGSSSKGKLDLIPSELALVEIQNSRRQTENKLKRFLHEKAQGYDFVIIDCPPTISIFTEAAILASNKYVVPIKPDPLSVVGLPLLERYIEEYTNDNGMKIEQIGIVFTQVRGPTPQLMQNVMKDIRHERGATVFSRHLSLATCVAESVDNHAPLYKYNKTTPKLKSQIYDITREFLQKSGG